MKRHKIRCSQYNPKIQSKLSRNREPITLSLTHMTAHSPGIEKKQKKTPGAKLVSPGF